MSGKIRSCPNEWCASHRSSDQEIRRFERPIVMPDRLGYAVACPVCPMQTPWRETEAEAIDAWNERPVFDGLLETSETLLRMLEAAYRQLGMWSDDNKRVVAAKAAIARARGEQP